MSHIFISYSKRDIEFARHLRHLLQEEGFAVWMDERLVATERSWPTIDENIASSSAVIVIMSPNSHKSRWVEYELAVAGRPENQKPVFPVLLAGDQWELLGGSHYEAEKMTDGLQAVLSDTFIAGLKQFVQPFTSAKLPKPLKDETTEIRQISQFRRFSRFLIPISFGLNILFALLAIASSGFNLFPDQPSATPSRTATTTPRPATSTAAPTATYPPITRRDYIFELSDSSLWELNQIVLSDEPHAYRAVGTDPYIELQSSNSLGICLADYSDVYLQTNSPLGEEIQIFMILENDSFDTFNGERAFILANYTREGFASYSFPIERIRFLTEDSRLESIRIHLGNSGETWYLFDFRLIRSNSGSRSRCN